MSLGIHVTPRRNLEGIAKRGIDAVPFWRSIDAWRHPLTLQLRYEPCVNIVEGKSRFDIWNAAYDSLKAGKIHLDGSSRGRFGIARLGLFFVDTENETILQRREKNLFVRLGLSKRSAYIGGEIEELRIRGPIRAIKEIRFSRLEMHELDNVSRSFDWFSGNMMIAEAIASRIESELARITLGGNGSLLRTG